MKPVEIALTLLVVGLGYLVLCRNWKIDDDYEKLPKLFMLDDYDECMESPDGLYCYVDIELTTEEPSDLWYRIKNITAKSMKYFEHDIVHRGICVTKNSDLSVSVDALHTDKHVLQAELEMLALKELKEEYGFGGNVTIKLCKNNDGVQYTSLASWIYAGVLVSIILANIVPSLVFMERSNEKQGLGREFIQAFNISRNWAKLTKHKEEGKNWLQGVQGLRTIMMILVIIAHAPVILYNTYTENPEVIEMLHDSNIVKILLGGTLVIQISFCLSSFLMSYQFLKYAEQNHNVGFKMYPIFLFQRWLRLTPAYAVIIGFVALWCEKLAMGPLSLLYNLEADTCRRVWWHNLLYTHNLTDGLLCVPQAWYLAVETQLFCLGLFIMIVLWKWPEFAKYILGGTLIIATIIPGVLTYTRGYAPALIITPDDTFINIYTQIQGNASSYILGMISGYTLFHLERRKINLLQMKGTTYLLYAIVPITIGIMSCGSLVYMDQVRLHPLIAAIFASLSKPIIAGLFGFFFICISNKLEIKFLENRMLVIPGRLTYCALLVHVAVQKYLISALHHPVQIGYLLTLWLSVASIVFTYFIAMLFVVTRRGTIL